MVGSQFLSAFPDNMAMFLVSAAATQWFLGNADEYVATALVVYFAVYVLISPWAGNISEKFPKGKIFILANGLRALFFIGIILKWNPIWSYAFFGIGAVLYSPAKYGILPFLCPDEKSLMRGNALVEGSTTIAVILGTVIGSKLSDQGIELTALVGIGSLVAGAILAKCLPDTPTKDINIVKNGLGNFIEDLKFFFSNSTAAFSVLGAAVFWMGTRTLQPFLLLWVPTMFHLEGNGPVGLLTGVTAVGTIVGALSSPYLVSYWQGNRILISGLLMGAGILIMSVITNIYILGGLLFIVGIFGGLYLIPVNSLNEHVGEHNMGAGRSVAVQNFTENLCSFGAVSLYGVFRDQGVSPYKIAWGIGIVFISLVLSLWPLRTKETVKKELN